MRHACTCIHTVLVWWYLLSSRRLGYLFHRMTVCMPCLLMWHVWLGLHNSCPTLLGVMACARPIQVRQTRCWALLPTWRRTFSIGRSAVHLAYLTVWDVMNIWRCSFVSDLRSSQRCRTSDFVRTSSVNKETYNGDRVTQSDNRFVTLYSVNTVHDGYKLSYKLEHCSQY